MRLRSKRCGRPPKQPSPATTDQADPGGAVGGAASAGHKSARARAATVSSRRTRVRASRCDGTVCNMTRMVIVVASALKRPTSLGGSVLCPANSGQGRHPVRRFFDHLANPIEVGRRTPRQDQIHDGASPAREQVADQADVAVGNGVDGAVDTPKAGQAHRDFLDDASDATDGDGVPDVVLVLHRHDDAGEVVAHDLLSPEAQGGADDGGAGQQGGQIDAQHAEHDPARHDEDEEPPHVGHQARHGGDPSPARSEPRLVAAWSATRSRKRRITLEP